MDIQELKQDLDFLKLNLNTNKSVLDYDVYTNLLYTKGFLILFNPVTNMFAGTITGFASEETFTIPIKEIETLLKRFRKGDIEIAYDADANIIQAALSDSTNAEFIKAGKHAEKYHPLPKTVKGDDSKAKKYQLVTADNPKLLTALQFLKNEHPIKNDRFFMDRLIIDKGVLEFSNIGYAYTSMALVSTELNTETFYLPTGFGKFADYFTERQPTTFSFCNGGEYVRMTNGYRFLIGPSTIKEDRPPLDLVMKNVEEEEHSATFTLNTKVLLDFIESIEIPIDKPKKNRLVFDYFQGALSMAASRKFKDDKGKDLGWTVTGTEEIPFLESSFNNSTEFDFKLGYDLVYIRDMLKSLGDESLLITFIQDGDNPKQPKPMKITTNGKHFLLQCLV